MKKALYIDLHAIQTVPPSCVNRDDTGMPKVAVYGGVERARISSQAWKHAMREYFKGVFPQNFVGSRTKQVPSMIAEAIERIDASFDHEKAIKSAMDALKYIGIKTDDKKNENSALFFISKAQVEALARLAVKGEKDKKCYQQAVKDNPSIDIALFGRMVADDASLNYDAAAQVAHAISTHGVQTEYDYFTAVDDEKAEGESGAGHLGTVAFNSATLYRYATLNVSELVKNLGDDAVQAAAGFVEAFVLSMPTGKQNTFANRTLPDLFYVTIRHDQPVNLSGAFEKAIRTTQDGYVGESCTRLLSYAEEQYGSFADKPEIALGCGNAELLSPYAEVVPLKTMFDRIKECVVGYCKEVE